MRRLLLLAIILTTLTINSSAADEAKGKAVPHEVYFDYFEKNTAQKDSDEKSSYLAFTKKTQFDDRFSLVSPLMGKKRPIPVPDKAFDKNVVVAVIKRGNAISKYKVEQVTVEGDTLEVQYKATPEKTTSATFASPLIISTELGKLKKVTFIENGVAISTVEIK